jgi:hypothetical protein
MRARLAITGILVQAMIALSAGLDACAQANPPQAQSGPQDPRSTQSDARPGESLTERLNRTDGVIRPPDNIAPRMPQASPPTPDPGTTPVIPPPGTPGGSQQVDPK